MRKCTRPSPLYRTKQRRKAGRGTGYEASACKYPQNYKAASMNQQLPVCCVLVFSALVSLHLPAESAPTHERHEYATSADIDTNPLWQWRDKLRALLDSNSNYVATGGYWMLRGLSSLTCDACELAVGILLDLFHLGKEWDYLATAAGDICYVLKIDDRNVCMPITQLFKVLMSNTVCL